MAAGRVVMSCGRRWRSRTAVLPMVVGAALLVVSTTGAKAARGDDALQATTDLVRSGDADLRAVGLERVRDGLRGATATRALADTLLPTLDAPRQRALVTALAERGDAAALPGILRLLDGSADEAVRAAALLAVATLGGPGDVPVLVRALTKGGAEEAAARRGLVIVGGAGAVDAIRTAARTAPPAVHTMLCDILASRRATAAAPDLVAAAVADDAGLRGAALQALAQIGSAAEVPGMVRGVLRADAGRERDEAERALVAVCSTGRDRERAAAAFLEAFNSAPAAEQALLAGMLGRLGGPRSLALVEQLLADPARRSLGLEALSRWPDASIKDRLLELFAAAADDGERNLLLATLIRIAPLPNNTLDDAQKLELLRRTMDLCQRDEDRRRVLERANAIRTVAALRFVVPYLDQPALAESACLSVVELAHHQKLRDDNKAEFTTALDRVLAMTKNPELVERSQRYKEGRTWNRKAPGG